MKVTIKLVLIIVTSQFVFGCEKKETADNPSPEPAVTTAKMEETPAPPTATPMAETPVTETPAVEPQQPTPEPEELVETAPKAAELPTAAPLKGLDWVKGDSVKIEKEKVYLIEFWATWCPPCKVSIPHLTEIQKKYKDKGLTVIGVSTPGGYPEETIEKVKSFVGEMGEKMDYTVAFDTQGFVRQNYMTAFGAQGIPHAFIIDRNGKIAWQGHPAEDMDTVLELVVQDIFDPVMYAKGKADAEALLRQCMAWYTDYFQKIHADGGLNDETKKIAGNFIENAPVEGLNAMAWNILTQVKEPNRDLEAALKAAEKANQLTAGKDPSVLDTYAMALFENGKIDEAIQAQLKLIDLAKDYPQALEQLRQTLEKYKAAANQKNL